ncbi:hypothetical protein I2I05_15595 [Hymenobacter sp. BT683]|uniref:Uncharacterized protein n=1 Tax=Hymenobacter jeongseonensis TaxID=2791027 RepID=A0ABS0IKG2_9BACT|nr:hypothetical protein [Hymenobacter jeongseonensis]MBF9238826.1 hypothetical protein [Hymenobacter jeongseonensis]
MMFSASPQFDALPSPAAPLNQPTGEMEEAVVPHRNLKAGLPHQRIRGAVATTATRLLPLVALLDTIQPAVDQESVFRTRKKKIKLHLAEAYAELQTERPRRQALSHAFQTLAELVLEETRDISRDELKQAAKEVVLATLKNAPALINIAHQARLLS